MLYEDNYLAHFGIKGQKWGVRRFQNDDGTLTEEGKKRYKKGAFIRETEAIKDMEDKLASKSKEIDHIRALRKNMEKSALKREQEYIKYLSSMKLSQKDKKDFGTAMDSIFGKPIVDNDDKERYEFEATEILFDKLENDVPDNMRKTNYEYWDRYGEYVKAIGKLEQELIKEYSGVTVYSTKKSIFGIEVMDKQTSGESFIQKVLKEDNKMLDMVGKPKDSSNLLIDYAVKRLYRELNVDWYNNRFK